MTEEEGDEYKVADAINALLDDLEQDVIAEMHAYDGSQPTKKQIGWNQALVRVLTRLKTYRRE